MSFKFTWDRRDVEAVIGDAQTEAKRSKRTQFVGGIGCPDGGQIYGEGTLGYTVDKDVLEKLGTVFATVKPCGEVERHQ